MRRIFLTLALAGFMPALSALHSEPPADSPHAQGYGWKTGIPSTVYSLPALDKDLFYIALPFDDLKHPDLTSKWLPFGWLANGGGKPLSACKGRWIQIKNSQGRNCYAQWQGTGPLSTDDAPYVFGTAAPANKKGVGIALSPKAAEYLGIDENIPVPVSWRFINDLDVPPGRWLTSLEQTLLLTAITARDKAVSGKPAPLLDKYLTAYLAINQGENDEKEKKLPAARDAMLLAQNQLNQIESIDPNWERALVTHRLSDIRAKLDDLTQKLAPPPKAP